MVAARFLGRLSPTVGRVPKYVLEAYLTALLRSRLGFLVFSDSQSCQAVSRLRAIDTISSNEDTTA